MVHNIRPGVGAWIRQHGGSVRVTVLGIDPYTGKWEVRNETTGRMIKRTTRQLHLSKPLEQRR